jgi:glycosyltransferase involved in cell wall biosynthesis
VAFFRHSYYNFYFLAQALRRRGWNAIVVNSEPEDGPNERYFFGQDLRTHHPNPKRHQARLRDFLLRVAADYSMLHFHGVGGMWVLPQHSALDSVPWELLELKNQGVKFGFTVSGCLDMVSQESFRRWSRGVCSHCSWQKNAAVCSDQRNLLLGKKVLELCELVCNEGEALLDLRISPRTYLEPLTGAIDPEFWHPELEIPPDKLRPREDGEFIIYHALGNAADRLEDGADIKGSRVILEAIENLKSKGHKVRLDFVTNLPSKEVRYAQLQADVIVDQLRYGRWGATAREGLMLGKPVIANVLLDGGEGHTTSQCIQEAPVVHATPESIETVLEELVKDQDRQKELGRLGRQHALKWYSADACAARYEEVYDRLMRGESPRPDGSRT